jgi:beta-mannosidase
VVSDRLQQTAAQLNLSLLDFDGNKLWGQQQDLEIAPLKSKSYLTIPIDKLVAGKEPKEVFLFTEVLVGGKRISSNEHFFKPYKDLAVPRPQIKTDIVPVRGGFQVSLSADKFARAVYLSAPGSVGSFTDNYFDLIPGQQVEVTFRAGAPIALSAFRNSFKVQSMADAF